jgi:hypothetical protein
MIIKVIIFKSYLKQLQMKKKIYLIFLLDNFEQFIYEKLNSILFTLFHAVYSDKNYYSTLTIDVSNRFETYSDSL